MANSFQKVSVVNYVIFALALSEVTSWTIDLPEVRKYFFEKNEKIRNEEKYHQDYKYKNEESPIFYNNIEGNSKHNTKHYEDVYENTAYAKEYGYQSYMEKKVNDIVYNGSVYLEGLRRSLENYTRAMEECGRTNDSRSENTTTWRPPIESARNTSSAARCRQVSRTSEHVRRLAALAAAATRELQDLAYTRKYKKDDEKSLSMEENELILKLAWFLDRLAHYTGYEPEPRDFLKEDVPPSSTTTPAPLSLMSAPPELERLMMECLKQNSSEPAVDRCRYPEPLPPLVQMMMEMNSNITGIPAMPVPSSSNQDPQVIPISQADASSDQSMELLVAADYRTPSLNQPGLTAGMIADYPSSTSVRSVKKRSILSMVRPELKSKFGNAPKRSVEIGTPKYIVENAPAINFLKYYAKHKIWVGANYNLESNTFESYDVKNELTHKMSKRAIDNKKFSHLKLPENPFQDLSEYIKHRHGVNYVIDEDLVEKIKADLAKMDKKPSKNLLRKLTKKFRQKRSVTYEKDVDKPRESVDPQGDISFYVKNKPGRNYNPSLVQAGQVRAGLQQVFNTGNIEVVRRFGANYNPLIPDPFTAGIIKSQADLKK